MTIRDAAVVRRAPLADDVPVDASALWDALLTCQVGLTLPLELPYLFRSSEWLHTSHVLDVGCGNGAHMAAVADIFPDKQLMGVDCDDQMIELARRRCSPRVQCALGDAHDIAGRHDFVIARLIAQHVASVERFLSAMARALAPGGTLLSVEPDDGLRMFVPTMPRVEALYRDFVIRQTERGFDRAAGLAMCEHAGTFGLRVVERARVVVPSSLPGHKRLFERFHRLIFPMFQQVFAVSDHDTQCLVDELDEWIADPSSYAQLGIHVALMRKMDA